MKKILLFLIIISVYGCKTEGDVAPANENTFIRFFGTEDNNTAVLAIETAEGFTLLSNSEGENAEGQRLQKIKLIQTDKYGHKLEGREKNYPENGDEWRAASFIETPDSQGNPGYLIIGESIKSNSTTDLFIFWTDNQDNSVEDHLAIIPAPDNTSSLHGRAVTTDPVDGSYTVLANLSSDPAPTGNDMFVYKINPQDFSITWSGKYGAGLSSTISRIYYYNNNQNLLWGGSVLNSFSNKYDVRLVQVPVETEVPITGGPIGEPDFDEDALDLCQSFGGWAFTGSSDQNGAEGIFVLKVTSASQTIFSSSIEGSRGVSITPTNDGGLAVLGEVSDKNVDLKIAKLNASGVILWQHNYGGADRQEAASIRQTADGSYLVFATTYFVNEKKLMLLKVNGIGKL